MGTYKESITTIVDTVLWLAEDIQASDVPCQNLTSAIQSVLMDISAEAMVHMKEANEKEV